MRSFLIELRNPRLYWWSAIIALLWVLIPFFRFEFWNESWRGISIWLGLPSMYVTALVAAAGAFLYRSRRQSSLSVIEVTAKKKYLTIKTNQFLSIWGMCVCVPGVIASGVLVFIGVISGASGEFTLAYLLSAVLLLTIALSIGMIIGTLITSAVFAPLLGMTAGLWLGMYYQVAPPFNPAWIAPNLRVPMQLLALTILWYVAFIVLSRLKSLAVSGRFRGWQVKGIGLFTVTGILAAMYFSLGFTPTKIRTTGDVVCGQSEAGSEICVWQDDAELLPYLTERIERFETLRELLENNPITIAAYEPGILRQTSQELYVIEPGRTADDNWILSGMLAYTLLPTCDRETPYTQEELEQSRAALVAQGDAMTEYIASTTAPSSMQIIGGEKMSQDAKELRDSLQKAGDDTELVEIKLLAENVAKFCN